MTERIQGVVTAATWGGAAISTVGAVTLVQWMALGGFLLAVCGFVFNVWFKTQILKIEKEKLHRTDEHGTEKDI